jgi:hypothetical protein
MGRPSTVYGRLSRQDEGQAGATGGGARVQIGGSCVLVAWGGIDVESMMKGRAAPESPCDGVTHV